MREALLPGRRSICSRLAWRTVARFPCCNTIRSVSSYLGANSPGQSKPGEQHLPTKRFCAGENKAEVQETIQAVHRVGFSGIILEYASEVLDDGEGSATTESKIQRGIDSWKSGMLATINVVDAGDFIGLKWSGMGPEALRLLKEDRDPPAAMYKAMTEVCNAAQAKGIRILPAAEPQNANRAVDAWSIELASKYNKEDTGAAVVYNTYQCYLKSTPHTLARHLSHAAENNYTLGVKLVRGAYLGSEQRNLIWDTKAETDAAYDNVAKALLQGGYNETLKPVDESHKTFPKVNVILATHNEASVLNANEILEKMNPKERANVKVDFAQLQGMADEVSCKLLDAQASTSQQEGSSSKIYKCVTWGTVTECLNYLLRRAAENRDALGRTVDTRKAMGSEILRRFRKTFLRTG